VPFYLEEVHILARREIAALRDLDGKRVSIGEDGSGTWLTAQNIFEIAGIAPAQMEQLKTEDAEIMLLSGDLDAVIYVVEKPAKAFDPLTRMAAASNDPKARAAVARLHFVPVSQASDPLIFAEYDQSMIGPRDYPWLTAEVPVAAVRAVLVGFDFSSLRSSYYKERCRQFRIVANAARENLHEMQGGSYRRKWKEVTLERSTPVPGWQFDPCSQPGRPQSSTTAVRPSDLPLQERLKGAYFTPSLNAPGPRPQPPEFLSGPSLCRRAKLIRDRFLHSST
jgi:uncharacterized protein